MYALRFAVTLVLLASASWARSDDSDHYAYYSLYQDPKTIRSIPIGLTGSPDFDNVEDIKTIRGFKDRFDFIDDPDDPNDDAQVAANRCTFFDEAQPGTYCIGSTPDVDELGREIVKIGLNSGVIQAKNGVGGNRIRFFVPRGTRALSGNLHFNSGRGEVAIAYRLEQPVGGPNLQAFSTGMQNGYELLEQARGTDVFFLAKVPPTANFLQFSTRGNWEDMPPPSTEGTWMYVDFPCFSASEALTLTPLIQISAHVVLEDFLDWYETVGSENSDWKWDSAGDPIRKDGFPDDYTPILNCRSVTGLYPPVYDPNQMPNQPDPVDPDPVDPDPVDPDPVNEPTAVDQTGSVAVYNVATGELYLPEVVVIDEPTQKLQEVSADGEQPGEDAFHAVKIKILIDDVISFCKGRADTENSNCQ